MRCTATVELYIGYPSGERYAFLSWFKVVLHLYWNNTFYIYMNAVWDEYVKNSAQMQGCTIYIQQFSSNFSREQIFLYPLTLSYPWLAEVIYSYQGISIFGRYRESLSAWSQVWHSHIHSPNHDYTSVITMLLIVSIHLERAVRFMFDATIDIK